MILAQIEESNGQWPAAIAHYQRLIEIQPANSIALNNLAYALAVHRNAPAEGLVLAKRAATLAPRSASILDTWGWIEHLLGNDADAAKILADAIKLDPRLAETWLHAAIVSAAVGDRTKAENELKEALRLDPTLEQRDDTRKLRERISALPLPK
jgi:tetratricopeptide (TPR) repeat protein